MADKKTKSPTMAFCLAVALVFSILGIFQGPVFAQSLAIPNFWDPNVRFLKPDLSGLTRLKFLTTTDFPPFNFIDRNKRLSGFNIDLARAICVELDILPKCQIQALPWEELQPAIEKGEADAIIAGLEVTVQSRSKYLFSEPYLIVPGRFVSRRDAGLGEPMYKSLFNKTVGVVEGSSHETYFGRAFGERKFASLPSRLALFNALKNGSVDAVFTDAVSASFWLASKDADNCCGFAGEAYLSTDFLGSGLTIATGKQAPNLVAGFNYALKEINDTGKFSELYLKYFPLGLY